MDDDFEDDQVIQAPNGQLLFASSVYPTAVDAPVFDHQTDNPFEINPCRQVTLGDLANPFLDPDPSPEDFFGQGTYPTVQKQPDGGDVQGELDALLLEDRNRDLQQVEADVSYVTEAMRLLGEQVHKQGEALDAADSLLGAAADDLEETVIIINAEGKRVDRYRKLKAIGWGAVVVTGAGILYLASSLISRKPTPLGNNANDNGNSDSPPQ